MLNSKAKKILVKECFKISTHSGIDSSAEKITDGPKMGKVSLGRFSVAVLVFTVRISCGLEWQ